MDTAEFLMEKFHMVSNSLDSKLSLRGARVLASLLAFLFRLPTARGNSQNILAGACILCVVGRLQFIESTHF